MKNLLFLALMPAVVAASPVINEFVAENQHGITDQDGARSDWVEIYNPDGAAVNMSGWFLTDDAAIMNKWAFPAVTIPPGGLLIVFASGKDRAVAGSELHTNFSLDAGGEYLALSQPGGAGITTQYAPEYLAQRDGYSFGRSQDVNSVNVLASVTPTWIVPTSAGALAADWNAPTMASTVGWQNGTGTGAVGYETQAPPLTTGNITTTGTASQSSTNGGFAATLARDGNYTNFSHTLGSDTTPVHSWQNTFAADKQFASIKIFNRTSCCQSRLRDITVKVLDSGGTAVFTSALLNPENTGYAYPGGPTFIELNLVALTGDFVVGRTIRVERAGDPDLSGTAGQGNTDEARVLSMAEVEIVGVTGGGTIGGDSNIAPSGTASQSTTNGAFTANLAINNNTTDFTHTVGTDTAPKWILNLGSRKIMSKIVLSNRTSCCGSRLRDITIVVKDQDNSTVTYTSPLLNPENTGYAFPNGPATLEIDFAALTGGYIVGQYIEVSRTPDPDLSGSQAQGNQDEANVLSLGEVTVTGNAFGNFQPLITTDVKAAMYNVNTSAFVRWPFTVADPATVTSLKLKVRYDDGFIAYLNGVEVARRNATGVSSAWDSAATGGDRNDGAAVNYEDIDVTAFASSLVTGGNVIAIQGLTSAANDPDFLLQAQLVMQTLTVQAQHTYLRQPTPGALNDSTWFLDFVKDTSFTVQRGFYSSPQNVEISTLTPGVTIRYTTNGSTPGETNGTVYSGPINISATTVLRARAFKPDWEPTNTDTQTYLFLNDVLGQQPTGAPPPNWPASPIVNAAGQSQLMNYGMDQNVRTLYGDAQMLAALTQIPSISLVTDQANFTDPLTGIYANASGHGEDWERPASIEWLEPSKPAGQQGEFQHNCGIRIRGGASRNPDFIKHSLRIYFRDSYSVGKLNYPIFGAAGASEHDVIDLASSQNYSWARPGSNPQFDTMVRDPFARQTLLDCGSPSSRTRYFHLYLNGIYWGLYWFDERPLAGYGEAYFGGGKDDYDVIKCGNRSTQPNFIGEATDGYFDTLPGGGVAAWKDLWTKARAFATAPGVTQNGNPDLTAYFAMLGRDADGTPNAAIPRLVDENSLIDYMLCIFYTGDGDAPLSSFLGNIRANNWFCMRSRTNGMGFVFFNHDAEHTLGTTNSQNDRTGPFNSADANFNPNVLLYWNPQWLFQDLCFSPEFRLRVADRAHKHFFNGGAMTAAVAQARMDALSSTINLAVKGHSMRWGDYTKTPAYNATDWQNAVTVARNYLAARHATVISQLRAYNLTTSYPDATAPLYPLADAPVFSQHGGNVTGGYNLTMTATVGTIYYTTNGTDPRAVGGAVAGTEYTGAVQISAPLTVVKARALNAGVWSALNEATFYADTVDASAANIVVSELHYHPSPSSPGEIAAGFTNSDDFEYIELMNIAATGVRLTGCYFDRGITFSFPATVIGPGSRIVIARNAAAFASRYGGPLAGEYTGGLSNGGEPVRISTPSGAIIKEFSYSSAAPWPVEPDGNGPSLVLRRPALNEPHGLPSSWRASVSLAPGGSDSGGGYAAWKIANSIVSDTADGDGDGIPAFLEYALGSSPTAADRSLLPAVQVSGGNVTLTIHHALTADDVTWVVESSTDLTTWTAEGASPVAVQLVNFGLERITYTFPNAGSAHFYRLKYSAP